MHCHFLQEILKKKGRAIAKLQGDAQTCLGRVKASPFKESMLDVQSDLDKCIELAACMTHYLSLVKAPAPEPCDFLDAKAALDKAGISVGAKEFILLH